MEIEWIAKLKIFLLPLSHLKPHRIHTGELKKPRHITQTKLFAQYWIIFLMNLSTSTINSLAKYFFPFCQQLNFIFLLLPSKIYFSFLYLSRRLVVCMLCGEKCLCKHWECLIFSFDCVAACTSSATSFSAFSWCAAVLSVRCAFLFRRAARKKKTFGERENVEKTNWKYCSGISFYKT